MSYFFTKYTYQILDQYQNHFPVDNTVLIGFAGTASERTPVRQTPDLSDDWLIFGATVNFSNASVLVRIRSTNPAYEWMGNNNQTPQDTPINAIAGVFSQVLPVLPLVQPFFLEAQSTLQLVFTNDSVAPVTGGMITFRGLRLVGPKNGGWSYARGFTA